MTLPRPAPRAPLADIVRAAEWHLHPQLVEVDCLGRLALAPHDEVAVGDGAQRERTLSPRREHGEPCQTVQHGWELEHGQGPVVRSAPSRAASGPNAHFKTSIIRAGALFR